MWNSVFNKFNRINAVWCVIRWAICFKSKWRDGKQVRKEEKANHLVTHGMDDGRKSTLKWPSVHTFVVMIFLFVLRVRARVYVNRKMLLSLLYCLYLSRTNCACLIPPWQSIGMCLCVCVLSIGNMQRMHCIWWVRKCREEHSPIINFIIESLTRCALCNALNGWLFVYDAMAILL